mgnify:CR=1 FL=1
MQSEIEILASSIARRVANEIIAPRLPFTVSGAKIGTPKSDGAGKQVLDFVLPGLVSWSYAHGEIAIDIRNFRVCTRALTKDGANNTTGEIVVDIPLEGEGL